MSFQVDEIQSCFITNLVGYLVSHTTRKQTLAQ